jgi:hypothetical protein
MKNKYAKQIQRQLRQALVFDVPMSQALYEYELAEHVDDFRQSLFDDQDEFLFSVTEHSGDVAMMLIERTGEVYVNEDAKEKLKEAWQSAYISNLNKLLPTIAEQLGAGSIPYHGVKFVP